MNTQYKKGVLELCVLSLLHKQDCYGYEISDFLSQCSVTIDVRPKGDRKKRLSLLE